MKAVAPFIRTGALCLIGLLAWAPCCLSATPDDIPVDVPHLPWYQKQTLDAYDKIADHNPKWEADARHAVDLMRQVLSQKFHFVFDDKEDQAYEAATKAMDEGCTDPYIAYIHLSYGYHIGWITFAGEATHAQEIAKALDTAGYPPTRKLYSATLAAMITCYSRDAHERAAAKALLEHALSFLPQAIADPDIPPDAIEPMFDAVHDACYQLDVDPKSAYDAALDELKKKKVPDAFYDFAKGIVYIEYAWQARGGGYADTVTEEGWRLFHERLVIARQALEEGWKADPTFSGNPRKMITIMMAEGNADERELWFSRALQADPDNYFIYSAKMLCLMPKWGGSADEAISFGKDAAATGKWSTYIPMVMPSCLFPTFMDSGPLQMSLQDAWTLGQPIYEEQLKHYPLDNRTRSLYAWLACNTGHWSVARDQFHILGNHVWPATFPSTGVIRIMQQMAEKNGK